MLERQKRKFEGTPPYRVDIFSWCLIDHVNKANADGLKHSFSVAL